MKKILATIAIFLIFHISVYAQNMFWLGVIFGPTLAGIAGQTITYTGALVSYSTEASSEDDDRFSALPPATKMFVQINMDFLRSDIATGAGDTIDALAVLMEVEDTPAFGKRLQANFEVIYPSYDVDHVHVANAIASFAAQESL